MTINSDENNEWIVGSWKLKEGTNERYNNKPKRYRADLFEYAFDICIASCVDWLFQIRWNSISSSLLGGTAIPNIPNIPNTVSVRDGWRVIFLFPQNIVYSMGVPVERYPLYAAAGWILISSEREVSFVRAPAKQMAFKDEWGKALVMLPHCVLSTFFLLFLFFFYLFISIFFPPFPAKTVVVVVLVVVTRRENWPPVCGCAALLISTSHVWKCVCSLRSLSISRVCVLPARLESCRLPIFCWIRNCKQMMESPAEFSLVESSPKLWNPAGDFIYVFVMQFSNGLENRNSQPYRHLQDNNRKYSSIESLEWAHNNCRFVPVLQVR